MQLNKTVTCPKCSHKWIIASQNSVEELKTWVSDYKVQIDKLNEESSKVKVEESEVGEIISELNNLRIRLNRELQSIKINQTNLERHIKSNKMAIDSYKQIIDTDTKRIEAKHLELNEIDIDIEKLKNRNILEGSLMTLITEKIASSNKTIISLESDINDRVVELKKYEDEYTELNQWVFNFKKFFTHLANKSLKLIEQRSNKYLRMMGSNLTLVIDGYKMLADGKIKENITPTILRNGVIEGSGVFGKLSGGERVRVEFASLLGRQEILNENSSVGGLGILFVDEITEGLDPKGLDILMSSLTEINKTVLIVTHITPNKVHNSVLVEKVNGYSQIKLS